MSVKKNTKETYLRMCERITEEIVRMPKDEAHRIVFEKKKKKLAKYSRLAALSN